MNCQRPHCRGTMTPSYDGPRCHLCGRGVAVEPPPVAVVLPRLDDLPDTPRVCTNGHPLVRSKRGYHYCPICLSARARAQGGPTPNLQGPPLKDIMRAWG